MEAFKKISAVAAPLPIRNIDTDMIIPKQFLKTIKRTGLGKNLFDEMRFDSNGNEIPDFILNKEGYRNAQILIADENFGCGSSREHAPWAILDFGIRVIIAPSFADIFYNNCFKNGILPIKLDKEIIDNFFKISQRGPNALFDVDLESQTITTADGDKIKFEISNFYKKSLLEGLDDIALTLKKTDKIDKFITKYNQEFSWN